LISAHQNNLKTPKKKEAKALSNRQKQMGPYSYMCFCLVLKRLFWPVTNQVASIKYLNTQVVLVSLWTTSSWYAFLKLRENYVCQDCSLYIIQVPACCVQFTCFALFFSFLLVLLQVNCGGGFLGWMNLDYIVQFVLVPPLHFFLIFVNWMSKKYEAMMGLDSYSNALEHFVTCGCSIVMGSIKLSSVMLNLSLCPVNYHHRSKTALCYLYSCLVMPLFFSFIFLVEVKIAYEEDNSSNGIHCQCIYTPRGHYEFYKTIYFWVVESLFLVYCT